MRTDFLKGARASLPILVSTAPMAVLFRALAVGNGLSVVETTLMSALVFAGSSQLVGIELFSNTVPAWLIVLSVFAVNFRHILYSAAASPLFAGFRPPQRYLAFFLLTDPQFALSLSRAESGRPVTFAWYIGLGGVIYAAWVGLTAVGALFGRLIGDPQALGLDVLMPVYFMGMVFGFRSRANFLPVVAVSATASVAAMHYVGSPWHVSIGAFAGILLAALLPVRPAQAPAAASAPAPGPASPAPATPAAVTAAEARHD